MFSKEYAREMSFWGVPALYAAVAIATGFTIPVLEVRIFPGFISPMSVSSATAIYSSIASGMIALTGIVFSLAFVMVQFSATAYSPRLVVWVARDRVILHSLGIFIATFLYGVAALAGIDRRGSGHVPFFSVCLEVALLLASVGMFIALINRVGLLQINRMLAFTGDQGRKVISTLYPQLDSTAGLVTRSDDVGSLPPTQTLTHHGGPHVIQAVDVASLVSLAKTFDGIIQAVGAVGDTVIELTPVLHVYAARGPIPEKKLRNGIELGKQRTFEQDPKYAIRLLVDIAIKALSPAINDPTTAVQALDEIEDLLLRLGQRRLEIGRYRDSEGKLRLIVPFPTWDDLLLLAFDEICSSGATSMQVMRRMNALVANLIQTVPKERQPALELWAARLKAMITRYFPESEERRAAFMEDRQGLGAPSRHLSG